MTYLGALALGMVVHEGTRRRLSSRRAAAAGASAALIAAWPPTVLLVAAGWGGTLLWARRPRKDQTGYRHRPDQLGQVLYIALSAGL
ncbi:MAG: hypothetical protein RI637_12890, partial [Acidimicrobiia bacterium]|nr:hypothetical protein [Acidimicrobiia bacterium]